MSDGGGHLGKRLLQRVPGCIPLPFGTTAKALLMLLVPDRHPAGHGRIIPDGKWTDMFHRLSPFGLVIELSVFGEFVLLSLFVYRANL